MHNNCTQSRETCTVTAVMTKKSGKQTDLAALTQTIIRENKYLTLATAGRAPWAAPLYYCSDAKTRFWVISRPGSCHIRHITKNNRVAFAIFDSHAPEGTGNGVQASGRMTMCRGKMVTEGLRHYHTSFIPCSTASLTHGLYRLYCIQPDHFWVLDPNAPVDKRIEVTLLKRR